MCVCVCVCVCVYVCVCVTHLSFPQQAVRRLHLAVVPLVEAGGGAGQRHVQRLLDHLQRVGQLRAQLAAERGVVRWFRDSGEVQMQTADGVCVCGGGVMWVRDIERRHMCGTGWCNTDGDNKRSQKDQQIYVSTISTNPKQSRISSARAITVDCAKAFEKLRFPETFRLKIQNKDGLTNLMHLK